METAGATKIFGRSVEKHGLYYTSFYGDGDSKAYPAVKEVYKNGHKTITKYECISHYQKEVGCRLRKLKKNVKGLGGKGSLPMPILMHSKIILGLHCGRMMEN